MIKTADNVKTEKSAPIRTAANVIAALLILWSVPFCLCDRLLRGESAGMFAYRLISPVLCVVLLLAEDGLEKLSLRRLPDGLYAFTRLFAVGAVVFGRTYDFYELIPVWDKILHTLSGVLFALLGACFAPKLQGRHAALYTVLFSLAFSLAVGYVWELFEFAGDSWFALDSQRWQSGIVADLGGGLYVTDVPQGAGLIDSMTDMLVNLIGTLITLPFIARFRDGLTSVSTALPHARR